MGRRNWLPFAATREELIEVSKGKRKADLYIRDGRVLNVYSGEILNTNVAVYKDRIAYVGQREDCIGERTEVLDADGCYISPGWIETHSHPWVLYNPVSLTEKVLPLGTTTFAHDDLFFFMHMGVEGFARMVKDLRVLPGLHLWLARIVSQAAYPGEYEDFHPDKLRVLLDMWDVIGTAEVTRWPIIYDADSRVLEVIEEAKRRGKVSDGHTSGCSYERLNAIAAAGISACHEAITAQEVLDRLRLGLWTVLRNSSLRPDMDEVIRAVTEHGIDTRRVMMTVDGPNPGFIDTEGFIDGLLRKAVMAGVSPMTAIQMVTLNAATYLGLDDFIGGIAPGRRADLLLLPDLEHFVPDLVVTGGEVAARGGRLTRPLPKPEWSSYLTKRPLAETSSGIDFTPDLFRYPASAGASEVTVPAIRFRLAAITERKDYTLPVTNGYAVIDKHPNLSYATLIHRHGEWIVHAILDDFMPGVEGLASTYNTTTDLLVIGRNPQAMAQAAQRVRVLGGGVVLVEQGKAVVEIPLPFTGMMTTSPSFAQAVTYYNQLATAVRARGYAFHDILYSFLFLACDFLPGLRLTPLGVIDVKSKEVLGKPAALLSRV
ncbi:MAG: amidohydrolase family protein [Alicyclobacillus herbarius]|uniref:adenine deaminase C-terminal domain-containing protein n=1 Tax=Alicyclobacillus herbarius TaxID=122960 RepID=UPI002353FF3B|nr:adenine deaminase C-terminal domain-containing protein [Alicyclobacillus herbarius]MCL6632210.1 amidohydrolase family protein [Alicyclobacillus herbarius]